MNKKNLFNREAVGDTAVLTILSTVFFGAALGIIGGPVLAAPLVAIPAGFYFHLGVCHGVERREKLDSKIEPKL